MQENNQRNSRKKLNALILLVAFTAILLIVSTYAWFSTQKNVTLSGLDGVVNVAEGLQISLDALNWANSIDLSEAGIEKYFAQTNTDLQLDGTTGKEKMTLEHPYANRTNIIPGELLPASTTGSTSEGIGLADFNFYRGKNTEGIKLSGIEKLANAKDSGFYAIDFFLQNSSAATASANDILQLTGNSKIKLKTTTKESTGLQNTFRVAFAVFDDDGVAANVNVNNTPSQSQILSSTTGADRQITDVAIWEPNASGKALDADGAEVTTGGTISTYAAHVTYIVQNNNRVRFSAADRRDAGLGADSRFAADTAIPTYALTSSSVGKEIADIYDWQTDRVADTQTRVIAYVDNGLVKQKTLQTPNTGVSKTTGYDDEQQAIPLVSVTDTDGTKKFAIAPGKYVRMRMYIWLEGQDVDCINYASLGGNLTIDVGLSKPGTK